MTAESIVSISAAVVALTQLLKWGGVIPDRYGALAVLVLSLLGVALFGFSEGTFTRAQTFPYFAAWIAVSLNAAGIFGFTRAASTAVSSASAPPNNGAGTSPTV